MHMIVAAFFAIFAGFAQAQSPETRCGWFSNPSPANAWLTDKDGEWTIAVQGGYQAEGDWPPEGYGRGQWVSLGPSSYGYGCACMKVTVDRQAMRVVAISEAKPRPLAACRKDKALAKAEKDVR